MELRDAVEADAESMAAIADAPTDVMRNLVHDRTVRVAQRDGAGSDPNDDADDGGSELAGFVSFDAREDTVHVTQLDGTPEACRQLLGEPVRFAKREGMGVELLVPDPETGLVEAAREVGFREEGAGPTFEGQPTTRFRLDP